MESYFQKLKEFKRIAMRLDKTDTSSAAMINLCAGASLAWARRTCGTYKWTHLNGPNH